jgi:RsiW-degrading membrane proteinase PrsW (M82 family)
MTFLIASITPVIIFLYLIYNKDRIKEPAKLLAKCFFGGFLSIIVTLIIDGIIQSIVPEPSNALGSSFYKAFLIAGLPEEFSKFIIMYWLVWRSKDFDQHFDGIIYAVFVSMGFALIENIMYVYNYGLVTAVWRGVLSVPGHGFFAVIMGYYFSLARFHKGNEVNKLLLLSLLMPALFHGLYDFTLFYASKNEGYPLLSVLLMIAFTVIVIQLWKVGLHRIKQHYLKDGEYLL